MRGTAVDAIAVARGVCNAVRSDAAFQKHNLTYNFARAYSYRHCTAANMYTAPRLLGRIIILLRKLFPSFPSEKSTFVLLQTCATLCRWRTLKSRRCVDTVAKRLVRCLPATWPGLRFRGRFEHRRKLFASVAFLLALRVPVKSALYYTIC